MQGSKPRSVRGPLPPTDQEGQENNEEPDQTGSAKNETLYHTARHIRALGIDRFLRVIITSKSLQVFPIPGIGHFLYRRTDIVIYKQAVSVKRHQFYHQRLTEALIAEYSPEWHRI